MEQVRDNAVIDPRPRVPATRREPRRFAWLSDLHLGMKEEHAAHRRQFEAAVAGVRAAAPDFTLVTGDLVDRPGPESYALFRELAGDLPGPVLCVPGNHDVGEKRCEAVPAEDLVTAEWLDLYRAEVGPAWQTFTSGGGRFLLLTSSLFGSGLGDEAAQWEWLERELAARTDGPIYLAFHHPLYLEEPDEPGGGYWNVEPEPRRRLLALMERHSVRAVFTGHLHRDVRRRYRDTELLTQTAVSFGLGEPVDRKVGWSLVTLGEGAPLVEFQPLADGAGA